MYSQDVLRYPRDHPRGHTILLPHSYPEKREKGGGPLGQNEAKLFNWARGVSVLTLEGVVP